MFLERKRKLYKFVLARIDKDVPILTRVNKNVSAKKDKATRRTKNVLARKNENIQNENEMTETRKE